MNDSEGAGEGAAAVPLFRPEALDPAERSEPFAFRVPAWRTIALACAAGAAALLAYGAIADFDHVAVVRGTVTPASGISRLVAPRAGIVAAIHSRQGAAVSRGAPLLRLAPVGVLAGGAAVSAESAESFRRQQALSREQALAEQRKRAAERAELEPMERQFAAAAASYRAQARLQEERISKNEERLRSMRPLLAKGYVSDVAYKSLEETVLSLRQQLSSLRQSALEAEQDLARTRFRSARAAAEEREAALESQSMLETLQRGELAANADAELVIAVPFSGKVAALPVSPGQAVAQGAMLAALVPGSGELQIELAVPPRSVGSLRPGQSVILRFDAFPYQRFGTGRAIIQDVAAAASPSAEGPVYRVRARLAGGAVPPAALRPDMTLSASIVIERRSLLDWLLAPLRPQWREPRG